jgi:hypothetical protein
MLETDHYYYGQGGWGGERKTIKGGLERMKKGGLVWDCEVERLIAEGEE